MDGGHRCKLSAEFLPESLHTGRSPQRVSAAETPELFADTLSQSQTEGWQLAQNLSQDLLWQLRLQQ